MSKNYRVLKNCITKDKINEELYYINGSNDFYITKSIKIYKYIDGHGYYKMSQRTNTKNGYVYCPVIYQEGYKYATERVHRIVALTFIPNDDKERKLMVGHKNNIKNDNRIENLYWTTNQENTKKAVDDGLNVQKTGIDNEKSIPILVTDLNNNTVAVYGGVIEATNMIENLNKSYLSKTSREFGDDYEPRNKKYKYFKITKDQYNEFEDKYKNIKLIESKILKKQARIFKAINLITGEEFVSDNQKKFASEHGLKQSRISHALRNKTNYDNWEFEIIQNISYTESSGYDNLINTYDSITIQHVETGEVLEFSNPKKLSDHFGFVGHGIKGYITNGNLIYSKWRIIRINEKLIA